MKIYSKKTNKEAIAIAVVKRLIRVGIAFAIDSKTTDVWGEERIWEFTVSLENKRALTNAFHLVGVASDVD